MTAGLTAAYFDGLTGTHSDPNTGKIVGAKLSTWEGVGQFAGNQVLQNGTSALLSSALGKGGSGSDALKTALFNTLAAASFNAVGDYTYGNFAEGTPPKVIIHAMVGGLLSKATGGDFRTGALAAGANEALVGHLNSLVNGNKNLLTMSSQIVGALAAATQKDADASSIEKGSWVARNATQYNKGLHEPAAMELEKARNENPDRAERLDAAACALVHCSASVPTSDKNYEGLKALEAKGAGYTRELADLKATGQFDYGYIDSADDFITRHDEAVTRTGAVIDTSVNTYIGGTSAVGAVITLPGCASIIGCLAPAALGGLASLSFNNAAESAGAITQPYVSTEGQRVLSSFNPASKTPDESALAAMGISAAASVAEAIILRGAGKLVLDAFGAGAKGISGSGQKMPSAFPDNLTGYANPKDIRFTQDSVKNSFSDGKVLQTTIDDLKSGKISPADLPAVRVFEKDGLVYSLDNRRVLAASAAGVPIKIVPATEAEIAKEIGRKMTTANNGSIICVRGVCK
ncbi:hypothetical protein JOE33_004849 [Pseudomonas sp. PvP027]|nr:hypothetical protein [Pseudomonas sp. PvP027]